ncbi:MAG: hypothetical protein Q9192_006173 [Flavoplaca navasiana]
MTPIHFPVHSAGFPTSTTHAYATADRSVQKNVNLLDHIALLLVFKAKGDVVATGLLHGRASFTLVWAKNSGYLISSPEQNYLASLLGAFVELQQPIQILKLVVGMCKIKILTWVKKLVNAALRVADSQSPPSHTPGANQAARLDDAEAEWGH